MKEINEWGKLFLKALIKGVDRMTSPMKAVWIIRIRLGCIHLSLGGRKTL